MAKSCPPISWGVRRPRRSSRAVRAREERGVPPERMAAPCPVGPGLGPGFPSFGAIVAAMCSRVPQPASGRAGPGQGSVTQSGWAVARRGGLGWQGRGRTGQRRGAGAELTSFPAQSRPATSPRSPAQPAPCGIEVHSSLVLASCKCNKGASALCPRKEYVSPTL